MNAGECQGNIWEWVQSVRGMLGNTGECQGNVWEWCKLPGECRECKGMPGEYASGCIVPAEYRELPGECKGAGVKCYGKGNAKECQGNV